MALSPADFYAYSRATGAPYPEDAEERAEMTPEVLEFRRNQLRAPDQGPNLLETLGLGALVAGGLAGVGFGAKRFLGGRQPKATAAAPGVTKTDLMRVAEASAPAPEQYAAPSKVATPVSTQQTGITQERMVRRHGRMVPASSVKRTQAAIPQATVNLTELQQQEQPKIVVQQIEAGDSGVDQQTARNTTQPNQRDIDNIKLSTERRRELGDLNVVNLRAMGLPEFEVNARMQQFANTGNYDLLNPDFNARTVEGGPTAFANALGIVNARVDEKGRVVSGELLNPQGETRRSLYGSKSSTVELAEGDFDPLAEMFGVEGGAEVTGGGVKGGASALTSPQEFVARQKQALETRRIDQSKLSEQYQMGIDNFAESWENLYKSGPQTGIHFPAREQRVIDAYDLDIPTRIEADPASGELYPTQRFRELLDEDTIGQVLAGKEVEVEVPFLVNKQRALADAEAFGNRMPELQIKAAKYIETGKNLVPVYDQTVGSLGQSKYIQAGLMEGAYFEPGETGITPVTGRGSQKGKLVGGTPELRVGKEEVYNLQYVPHTTAAGRSMKRVEGVTFPPGSSEPMFTSVTTSDLDVTRPDTGDFLYRIGQQPYDPDYITTQPVSVPKILSQTKNLERQELNALRQFRRGEITQEQLNAIRADLQQRENLPVGQIRKQGTSGRTGKAYDFLSDVYEASDEIVQAPLQVEDLEGNPVSYAGRVSRSGMQEAMERAERQLGSELNAARQDVSALSRQRLVNSEQATNINNFLNMAAGRGNLKENPVAQAAKRAGVPTVQKQNLVASRVQDELRATQGIQLPVLESPTAYEFVQSVIGRPANPPARRRLVSLGKEGQVFPITNEELLAAQEAGTMPQNYGQVNQADYSLTRRASGPSVLDITASAKDYSGRPTGERVGYGPEDFIDVDSPVLEGQSAYLGSVELGRARSPQEQRIATSPATKPLFTGGPIVGPAQEFFLVDVPESQRYPAGAAVGTRMTTTRQETKPRTLRFGSLGEQLEALDPQRTGQEMRSLRQQLATIKPTETVFSSEQLPSGLEVVTQQLMAQAGRRAGKRRNR